MPANARRLVRKMRGGAQAHLIEADDGHCYVVKFMDNPQHRRILVNELLASVFLDYLQIATPPWAIIRVSAEFLRDSPDVHIQLGDRRHPVTAGWHFGSRYPVPPDRQAVYDFLPDSLLEKVANFHDFLGVFVFDRWAGNADSRQAIFFRARLREWLSEAQETHPLRMGFLAHMVDNGFLFEGPHWKFTDSPLQGLYFRPLVYKDVRGLDSFQPWLDRVRHFPEEVVDDAVKQIPPEWLAGEEEGLEKLLLKLMARRKRIGDLVEACRGSRANPFPNWA
jgi:hypothetical protein